MKLSLRSTSAFSLVEVTLALGIAAFCLIAVFGLMPVGVQTNRNATSQTAATNILSSVVSDIRASPKGSSTPSAKYGIRRGKGTITTVCFDGQGRSTTLQGTGTCSGANYRYRLYVRIYPIADQPKYLATYAYLKLVWPAAVDPLSATIKPSGSVETVATFFYN
jgi:uncharacterized protein (TIGR02598 family)